MGGETSKPYQYDGTQITNRSPHPIWVKVDVERTYVNRLVLRQAVALGLVFEGKGGASIDAERYIEKQQEFHKIAVGFSKVQPDQSVTFNVDMGDKKIVYVSVISVDVKEGTAEVIADAIPKSYTNDFGFKEIEGLMPETVHNPKPC